TATSKQTVTMPMNIVFALSLIPFPFVRIRDCRLEQSADRTASCTLVYNGLRPASLSRIVATEGIGPSHSGFVDPMPKSIGAAMLGDWPSPPYPFNDSAETLLISAVVTMSKRFLPWSF